MTPVTQERTGFGALDEEWRQIADAPFYSVSSLGSVRSERRTVRYGSGWRNVGGAILRPAVVGRGYLHVQLRIGGRPAWRRVHRMVLEAFVGPRPIGHEARHLDGNPANNRIDNLAWGTKIENMSDRAEHGRTVRGERVNTARLTEGDVQEIRKRRARGESLGALAVAFDVSKGNIVFIVSRRTWAHVE